MNTVPEFNKDVAKMSFTQKLKYNIHSLKQYIGYEWKRHLVKNRDTNSIVGSASVLIGSVFLLNENTTVAKIVIGTILISYGVANIKARKKNGALDKIIKMKLRDEFKDNVH